MDANPRHQQEMSLYEIPHNLVYNILFKMPNNELIRMRKTCRYVNKTVEDNKKGLSKRTAIGFDLVVGVQKQYREAEPEVFFRFPSSFTRQIVSMDSSFERQFSGISIKNLYVSIEGDTRDEERMIATFFERLELHCDSLCFNNLPDSFKYLAELTDLVNCRRIEFPHLYLEGEGDYSPSVLLSAQQKSKFYIDVYEPPSHVLKHLKTLMNFKEVNVIRYEFEEEDVYFLIQALAAWRKDETLELFSVHFTEINPFETGTFCFPPTKILWKKQESANTSKRGLDCIHKLDMDNGKCALIIQYPWRANIRFVSNTPEDILVILIKELKLENFDSIQKKKYLETSEDEQIKMLQEFHSKQHDERLLDKKNKRAVVING